MKKLSASVGRDGRNHPADVKAVQEAINAEIVKLTPLDILVEDSRCGQRTIDAIVEYQGRVLRHSQPDGLVEADGPTWKALGGVLAMGQQKKSAGGWSGNSKSWSQDKKLRSMEPNLRRRVEAVIRRLKAQGFEPHIFYAWRSQAQQQKIIASGNSKVKISMHNITRSGLPFSHAADIVDRRYLWATPQCMTFFQALGKEAKAEGLTWGGDWSTPDWAHVQSVRISQQNRVRRGSN